MAIRVPDTPWRRQGSAVSGGEGDRNVGCEMKMMVACRHVKAALRRGLLIAVLTSGPLVTGAAAEGISDTLNSWFFGKPATEPQKPAEQQKVLA